MSGIKKAAKPVAKAAAAAVVTKTKKIPTNDQGGKYRVWNTDLPGRKALMVAFASLFGVGRGQALRICGDLGLNPYTKLHTIPPERYQVIKDKIESTFQPKHAILKRVGDNILAKVRMGSYQGMRHQMCLPVHGQRTRTNHRTQRRVGIKRAKLFNIPIIPKKSRPGTSAGGRPANSADKAHLLTRRAW